MGEGKRRRAGAARAPFARLKCLNALTLKCVAFACMLCDHMWATVVPGRDWMTLVGRIAFPIFAFLLAEGFCHTRSFGCYLGRMFLFALISELPFNLMVAGGPLFPLHQNVLFTFCLALLLMELLERARERGPAALLLATVAALAAGYGIGAITFVDYGGCGIWMVLLFYLTRGAPLGRLAQLIGMLCINWHMIGGLVYPISILNRTIEIPEQGLAVLALIPIWLYNGRRGPDRRSIQFACYALYPAHMLILALIAIYPR